MSDNKRVRTAGEYNRARDNEISKGKQNSMKYTELHTFFYLTNCKKYGLCDGVATSTI
jgi:hypothetical protein